MKFDYAKATSKDVPALVEMLRALRHITEQTGVITTRAQSIVLRSIPAAVLVEVATELEKAYGFVAVLSGQVEAVSNV